MCLSSWFMIVRLAFASQIQGVHQNLFGWDEPWKSYRNSVDLGADPSGEWNRTGARWHCQAASGILFRRDEARFISFTVLKSRFVSVSTEEAWVMRQLGTSVSFVSRCFKCMTVTSKGRSCLPFSEARIRLCKVICWLVVKKEKAQPYLTR